MNNARTPIRLASMAIATTLISCPHGSGAKPPIQHWVETATGAPVIARLDERGRSVVWMNEWPQAPLLNTNGAILTALFIKGLPATQKVVWEQRDPAARDESKRAELEAMMAQTAAELGEETGMLQEVVVLRKEGPVYYHLGKFAKQEQPVAFEWWLVEKSEKGRLWTQVEVHRQASPLLIEKTTR